MNNIKIRPLKDTSCYVIKLPAGKRVPSLRFTDRLHEYAQTITTDDAVARMLASNKAGHHKFGLVIVDDSEDPDILDAYFTMGVSSIFLSEAFGLIEQETEVLLVSNDVCRQAFQEGVNEKDFVLIVDLRDEPIFDSVVSRSSFVIVKKESPSSIFNDAISEAVYIGELPDAVALIAGKSLVCDVTLLAYFHVLGAEERFDVPDQFDILKAMSFGRDQLTAGDIDWDERVTDPYAPLISCDVIDWEIVSYTNPIFSKYRELARKITDLEKIWVTAQENACMGIRIPSNASEHHKSIPCEDSLVEAMNSVARMLGIEHSVDAYYDGIPIMDIVA